MLTSTLTRCRSVRQGQQPRRQASKLAAVYCPRPTLLHWLRPARSRRLLARLRTRHLRPIRPRERGLPAEIHR
ncbi:hypothetical protein [Photorhabdus bodei]|uniref:hypothetical protein n=1 Tax=Photorhabdus bodei TaxID=2029681 RepID=UPI00142DDF59|nr:hypothetical protein [Photorhabdus bodei]